MKQLVIAVLLGSFLTAAPAVAFHYFGHDQGAEDINRMQQQQERMLQQQERANQDFFRMQERLRQNLNPC